MYYSCGQPNQLIRYLENRSFWEESDGGFGFRDLENVQKHTCYLIPTAFCVRQIFRRNFQNFLTGKGQFLVKYSLYLHPRTFGNLPVLPLLLDSPSSCLSGQTTTILQVHRPFLRDGERILTVTPILLFGFTIFVNLAIQHRLCLTV